MRKYNRVSNQSLRWYVHVASNYCYGWIEFALCEQRLVLYFSVWLIWIFIFFNEETKENFEKNAFAFKIICMYLPGSDGVPSTLALEKKNYYLKTNKFRIFLKFKFTLRTIKLVSVYLSSK